MPTKRDLSKDIRTIATEYPETTVGTSCNKTTFKAGKKSFAFFGQSETGWNLMVKLSVSLDEVSTLVKEKPDNYQIGKHGWTTIRFPNGQGPTKRQLKRWIDESFRLLATKKLIAQLDDE